MDGVVPITAPASGTASAPSGDRWGTIRPFGALFEASFGLFRANMGWMLRLTFLSVLPMLPMMYWVGKCYVDWHMSSFNRKLYQDMSVFMHPGRPLPPPGNEGAVLVASLLLMFVVGWFLQAFWLGGIYGNLAARGRGATPTLNRAISAGCAMPMGVMLVMFWMLLRLIPWFLLLIVPGIVKLVAWSLAIPAFVSGAARSPEEALWCSDQATFGRKWIVFGYLVLLWLLSAGINEVLMPSERLLKLLPFAVVMLIAIAVGILQAMVGLIQLAGLWLAWADGIAPRNPQSPAAPFAYRGPTAPG